MDIVKVQLPLKTNNPAMAGIALVYAKGHKLVSQQKLDHASKLAMGDDVKAFFEARYRPSVGRWDIGARVEDRDW